MNSMCFTDIKSTQMIFIKFGIHLSWVTTKIIIPKKNKKLT